MYIWGLRGVQNLLSWFMMVVLKCSCHRPDCTNHACKMIGGSQKNDTETLDCQTLQSDRGLTKLPMIIAANNNFQRHLIYISYFSIRHWHHIYWTCTALWLHTFTANCCWVLLMTSLKYSSSCALQWMKLSYHVRLQSLTLLKKWFDKKAHKD